MLESRAINPALFFVEKLTEQKRAGTETRPKKDAACYSMTARMSLFETMMYFTLSTSTSVPLYLA